MSYVYKLTHKSGVFYIGKRTGDNLFATDLYWGSGTLLHACYRIQGYAAKFLHPAVKPFDWVKECVHDDCGKEESALEAALIREAVAEKPLLCLNLTHRGKQEHPAQDTILKDFEVTYAAVRKTHNRIYIAASQVAFATANKLFDLPSKEEVEAALKHLYPHLS